MYCVFLSYLFSLLGSTRKYLMSVMESFMEINDLSFDESPLPMGHLVFDSFNDFGLQDEWIDSGFKGLDSKPFPQVEEGLDLFLKNVPAADNSVDDCVQFEQGQIWDTQNFLVYDCDDESSPKSEQSEDFLVYDEDSLRTEPSFDFDLTNAEGVLDVLAKISSFDKSSMESFLDDYKPTVLKPEEIDSLLSSPTSPEDSLDEGLFSPSSSESSGEGESTRDELAFRRRDDDVICKNVYMERKQRKKDQNKSAASRYRQKKRGERSSLQEEYGLLEKRNKELREKVTDIAREIRYWKGLVSQISNNSTGIKGV